MELKVYRKIKNTKLIRNKFEKVTGLFNYNLKHNHGLMNKLKYHIYNPEKDYKFNPNDDIVSCEMPKANLLFQTSIWNIQNNIFYFKILNDNVTYCDTIEFGFNSGLNINLIKDNKIIDMLRINEDFVCYSHIDQLANDNMSTLISISNEQYVYHVNLESEGITGNYRERTSYSFQIEQLKDSNSCLQFSYNHCSHMRIIDSQSFTGIGQLLEYQKNSDKIVSCFKENFDCDIPIEYAPNNEKIINYAEKFDHILTKVIPFEEDIIITLAREYNIDIPYDYLSVILPKYKEFKQKSITYTK